ncbi:uncharacterized protein N7479_000723 [Penicillium vulpinum]|uniref:uncharacterized protein n=1 Tax=Penicillium vulpinum TaxID=29845 RepID=UPI002548B28A|nr:uncharacterized protein N7479_000723 [Penicillium vulpinum]KAJ5970805.1 hypothetical protein N7479_000723 [Penicillium vulpinum]
MDVEYPATLNDYIQSENDGANGMLQLANEYHSSWPGSKMGLLGYSQIFTRMNNTVCKQYSYRMASWCDKGDELCDAGHVDAIHGLYLQKYNATMVQYVLERWQNSTVSSVTTTAVSTDLSTSSRTTGVSTSTHKASPTAAESDHPSTSTASRPTILG